MSAAEHTTRADAYFTELARVYAAEGTADALTKRLASWLGNADQSVLLFLLLIEIRALRTELAAGRRADGERG